MRSFWIVLQQTYLDSIRNKSYIWMTLILMLLGVFVLSFPSLMEKFSSEEDSGKYVFVSNVSELPINEEQLEVFGTDYEFQLGQASNIDNYKEEITKSELDGLFVLKSEGESSPIQLDYYMEEENPLIIQGVQNFTQTLYQQQVIAERNLDPAVAGMLTVPIEPVMQPLRETDSNAILIIFLLVGVMYIAITTYGNSVATAITAEKSSRVMEVMITKISPVPMMFGKIIGIGLASLTQLFLFFATILLVAKLEIFEIPQGSIAEAMLDILNVEYTIYFLLFFILGYFIYAALFAVIGAMASRPEELSSSTIPITIVLMASLLVEMIFVFEQPESLTALITTYVPFTAPISLMVRIINGVISPVEITLGIGVMLMSIALFSLLAAKIYPKGALKGDQRLTFKQLIKSN